MRPFAKTRGRCTLAVLTLALFVGCSDDDPAKAVPIRPLGDAVAQPADARPGPHPSLGETISARGPRRLSVDELERTWEAVLELDPGTVVIPEALARSLGDPDYLSVTTPNLEPSPLFMKFMTDLALILCRSRLELDAQLPNALRITLRRDVDAGLQALLLRFWALDAPDPAHPDRVRLRQAFDAGAEGVGDPSGGWLAACVALGTAPEFLLY